MERVESRPFRGIPEYLHAELGYVRQWVGALAEPRSNDRETIRGLASPETGDWARVWAAARRSLQARVDASAAGDVELPLASVIANCGLSELEAEILRLLVALEIDPRLEPLFGKLFHDGVARTPDIRFLSGLFEHRASPHSGVLDALSPGRSLCDFHFVHVPPAETGEATKLFNRPVTPHPQLVRFVLHGTSVDVDPTLSGFVRLLRPKLPVARWIVDETERARLSAAFERAATQSGRLRVLGPRGVGKKLFVETMTCWRKQPLLIVEVPNWFDEVLEQKTAFDATVATLIVEAMLRGALIYLDVRGDERLEPAVARAIERGFRCYPCMLVVADVRERLSPWQESGISTLTLPMPTVEQRSQIWAHALRRPDDETARSTSLQALAHAFALTAGQIVAAVESARDLEAPGSGAPAEPSAAGAAPQRQAAGAPPAEGERPTAGPRSQPCPDEPALWAAARQQVTSTLAGLAERVETGQRWDDVVLPETVRSRLSELRAFAARRQQIYEQWGFGQKLSSGRGLTALFHGLPGTGKTMVAAIIARDLGLELFRVDLSRVVSKWVGETEKNLSTIFDAAEHAQALLLFDEADALFSTRTEVRSANDRYGNLEVNYLLQRMEQFDGTTILTTNHASALDKAFQRRLRFRVLFPPPDVPARALLWQRMIPEAAPIEPNVAWHKLAEAFDLTGGHIKNAVLRAAFRAADRDDIIRFDDLKQAAIVECTETGRLVKA